MTETLVIDPGPPTSRNVRAELARAGISHEHMAQQVKLSRGAWGRRLTGEVPWRITELQGIADRLDIPLRRLTEEPKP